MLVNGVFYLNVLKKKKIIVDKGRYEFIIICHDISTILFESEIGAL